MHVSGFWNPHTPNILRGTCLAYFCSSVPFSDNKSLCVRSSVSFVQDSGDVLFQKGWRSLRLLGRAHGHNSLGKLKMRANTTSPNRMPRTLPHQIPGSDFWFTITVSGGMGLLLFVTLLLSTASGTDPPRNQAARVFWGVIEVYGGLRCK